MRERFSEDEWQLVRRVPYDAFCFSALADGAIQQEEGELFRTTFDVSARGAELSPLVRIDDPLHSEIAEDWSSEGTGWIPMDIQQLQAAESADTWLARIERTRALLRDKLSEQEYQSFIAEMTVNAMAVARVSGDWIDEDESKALDVWSEQWGVDMGALEERAGRP